MTVPSATPSLSSSYPKDIVNISHKSKIFSFLVPIECFESAFESGISKGKGGKYRPFGGDAFYTLYIGYIGCGKILVP
ncbi:MAG: hypothetical protein HDS69_01050 [Bacteroidales bacterium]|nr:hypothetical protein [Bacteroidales bacterium]